MSRITVRRSGLSALLAFGVAAAAAAAALAPPPTPGRSERKSEPEQSKTLEIPAEQAAMGAALYLVPGKPGENVDQTRFTNTPPNSKREVDHFTGSTNAIIGYAIVESMGDPANLVAGEFRLPVDSLDTGIRGRNRHLQSGDFLDAKRFPDIIFKIKSARDIKTKSESDRGNVYEANLVGDMTMHGVTKEVTIPIEVAAINAGDRGQMVRIRAKYDVALSDFGMSNGVIGKRVANHIALEQYLVLSPTKPA